MSLFTVREWWGASPRHRLYPDEDRYTFHDLYPPKRSAGGGGRVYEHQHPTGGDGNGRFLKYADIAPLVKTMERIPS